MMQRSWLVACVMSFAAHGADALAQPAPDQSQVAAPPISIVGDRVRFEQSPSLSTDLVFEPGDAAIKPVAHAVLDAVAAALAKDASPAVIIDCYTDDSAPDSDRTGGYNKKLSRARAEAVAAYLAKHGVAAQRLVARGHGSDRPVAENSSDDGRRRNRRIELVLAGDVRPPDVADLAIYTRQIRGKGALIATIATNQGALHCQLFEDKAPATVANFVGLATGQKPWTDPKTGKTVRGKPFYDGLIFHRVISHFMIQGGDPLGNGTGGPGYAFDDEVSTDVPNAAGTLVMANAGPNTNGSQFFINEIDNPRLNMHYSVFGACKEVDLVAKIAALPHDQHDRPADPVAISKITFARGGQ